MKKSFVITGCATACIAVLVVGLSYFSVYKTDYKKESATQIIVSQEAGERINRQSSDVELDREISLIDSNVEGRNEDARKIANKDSLLKGQNSDYHMMSKLKELREEEEKHVASNNTQSKAKIKEELFSRVVEKPMAIDKLRKIKKESKFAADFSKSNMPAEKIAGITGKWEGCAPEPQEHISIEYQDTGRDKFEKITTNPVKLVSEEPVST
ncbi:MAG: hypothetical protein GY797_13615, partial [Deltaproteobacteria bacterium]|nr:hypothetical protein [Deltaproteobacteria bacterium]